MTLPTKTPTSLALPLWNNFVLSQPAPAPVSFNPSLFTFYKKQFGWKPCYFLIYRNNKVVALLPLVNTGSAWVSLPHFSYGGLLSNEALPEGKIIQEILEHTSKGKLSPGFYTINIEETDKTDMATPQSLFIRSYGYRNDDHFTKSEKVTYLFELNDKQSAFNTLSSNLRRKIRKASKEDFEIRIGEKELLNDFYSVYLKNIRLLHSLHYGKGFFNDLFDVWDFGKIHFYVVYRKNKPVAGALTASYHGFYENLYFATLPEVRNSYVSDWLHWQMIQHALEQKSMEKIIYSFGRSTEFSSVHQYKTHWPVSIVPLYYYTNLKSKSQNPLYRKILKLLPHLLTEPISPMLIKHIY